MKNIQEIATKLAAMIAEDNDPIAKELDEAQAAYRASGCQGQCPEWDRYKKAIKAARKAGLLLHQRNKKRIQTT